MRFVNGVAILSFLVPAVAGLGDNEGVAGVIPWLGEHGAVGESNAFGGMAYSHPSAAGINRVYFTGAVPFGSSLRVTTFSLEPIGRSSMYRLTSFFGGQRVDAQLILHGTQVSNVEIRGGSSPGIVNFLRSISSLTLSEHTVDLVVAGRHMSFLKVPLPESRWRLDRASEEKARNMIAGMASDLGSGNHEEIQGQGYVSDIVTGILDGSKDLVFEMAYLSGDAGGPVVEPLAPGRWGVIMPTMSDLAMAFDINAAGRITNVHMGHFMGMNVAQVSGVDKMMEMTYTMIYDPRADQLVIGNLQSGTPELRLNREPLSRPTELPKVLHCSDDRIAFGPGNIPVCPGGVSSHSSAIASFLGGSIGGTIGRFFGFSADNQTSEEVLFDSGTPQSPAQFIPDQDFMRPRLAYSISAEESFGCQITEIAGTRLMVERTAPGLARLHFQVNGISWVRVLVHYVENSGTVLGVSVTETSGRQVPLELLRLIRQMRVFVFDTHKIYIVHGRGMLTFSKNYNRLETPGPFPIPGPVIPELGKPLLSGPRPPYVGPINITFPPPSLKLYTTFPPLASSFDQSSYTDRDILRDDSVRAGYADQVPAGYAQDQFTGDVPARHRS